MLQEVAKIRRLLDGRTFDVMYKDEIVRAAFERYLEVLSEASRSVPHDWKVDADPTLPWARIRDLGNHLRHAYHKVDHEILWAVYENDLDALELALERMIASHGQV
jgi:uncharacterized protein with HEPN domain